MLSENDVKILSLLKKNAKLSSREISEKTSIPVTTVHNKIKKMEKEGVIKGYRAVLDKKKLGHHIHALIHITVDSKYMIENEITQEDIGPIIDSVNVERLGNHPVRITKPIMEELLVSIL